MITLQEFYNIQYEAIKLKERFPNFTNEEAFLTTLISLSPEKAKSLIKEKVPFNLKTLEMSLILDDFNSKMESIRKHLKKVVKDKSIPLELRWELFIKSNLGEKDYGTQDFKSIDIDEYLCIHNRYQTIYMNDIVEYYDSDVDISPTTINNLKEEILDMFVKSFIFDW